MCNTYYFIITQLACLWLLLLPVERRAVLTGECVPAAVYLLQGHRRQLINESAFETGGRTPM